MRGPLIVACSTLIAVASGAVAVVAWAQASAARLDTRAHPPQDGLQIAQAAAPGRLPPPVGGGNDQGPAPKLVEFVLYAQRSIALRTRW